MTTAANLATDLTMALSSGYQVSTTAQGWVEVRVRPDWALRADLDFIRLTDDDGMVRVFHLSHNEVNKGEATFQGSMLGFVPAFVHELTQTLF